MRTSLNRDAIKLGYSFPQFPLKITENNNKSKMSAGIDRGAAWSSDEMNILIDIWADAKIQHQLDNWTRKKPVFGAIARKLEEAGFSRSCSKVHEKLKKSKQQYKKVKDSKHLSGRSRLTLVWARPTLV